MAIQTTLNLDEIAGKDTWVNPRTDILVDHVFLKATGFGSYIACLKDGTPCNASFCGTPLTIFTPPLEYHFLPYAKGAVLHFEKTFILAGETGKKDSGDTHPVYLSAIATAGIKRNVSKSGNLVPACARCDGVLLVPGRKLPKTLEKFIQDETRNDACPYCGKPLEIIWRDGKVLRGELGTLVNAAGEEIIGILWKGVMRPVDCDRQDQMKMWHQIVQQCPDRLYGPVSLLFQYNGAGVSPLFWMRGVRFPPGGGKIPGTA
nr:hypothetical protein [Candidatus Sigynarchaeota archaeon]